MKRATLQKPVLNTAQALQFATGAAETRSARGGAKIGSKAAAMAGKGLSGQVPADDVRLTANIKEELHLKL